MKIRAIQRLIIRFQRFLMIYFFNIIVKLFLKYIPSTQWIKFELLLSGIDNRKYILVILIFLHFYLIDN